MTSMMKVESLPLEFNEEKLDLLKTTVCKGASNSELQLFLHVCKRTGLDPFMKQIYSIPRGGQRTIQTSIDGFRLIAERSRRYSPGKEPTFTYDSEGKVVSATSHIKKQTDDGTWHDVSATAFFSEYNPGINTFWKKMPHVMLAKCAEAAALRKAFPAELSGLYSDDEMEQAHKEEVMILEKTVEDQKEIQEKLSQFLTDFEKEDHEMIRCYIQKYAEHWKKTIYQSVQDYSDTDKFMSDFSKWKKKEQSKAAP